VNKQRRELWEKVAPFFDGKPTAYLTLVPPQRLVGFDQLASFNSENEKRAMRRALQNALLKAGGPGAAVRWRARCRRIQRRPATRKFDDGEIKDGWCLAGPGAARGGQDEATAGRVSQVPAAALPQGQKHSRPAGVLGRTSPSEAAQRTRHKKASRTSLPQSQKT
jgi:hypothetical protein